MDAILEHRGTPADVTLVESVATQMQGKALCALADFAASPILSTLKLFRDEYVSYTTPAKTTVAAGTPQTAKPAAKPQPAAIASD